MNPIQEPLIFQLDAAERTAARLSPFERFARGGLVVTVLTTVLTILFQFVPIPEVLKNLLSMDMSYEKMVDATQNWSRSQYHVWLVMTLMGILLVSIWSHHAMSQVRKWRIAIFAAIIIFGSILLVFVMQQMLPFAEMISPLHFALLAAYGLFMIAFVIEMMAMLVRIVRLKPLEVRALRSTPHDRLFSFDIFRRIFPLPRAAYFRRFGIIALIGMALSYFLFFKGAMSLINFGDIYPVVFRFRQTCLTSGCPAAGSAAIVPLLVSMVIAIAMILVSQLVEQRSRRLSRASLDDVLKTDTRDPVFFLRAFNDDQVNLPAEKKTWLGWTLDFLPRRSNLDEMLVEEGSYYGPVVALGSPGDKLPPYGAARGYFAEKDWKGAVQQLATQSRAIIICVDDTDGIWWEVGNLVQRQRVDKTLILFHPKYTQKAANQAIIAKFCEAMGRAGVAAGDTVSIADPLRTTAQQGDAIVGFFVTGSKRLIICQSRNFSRSSYLLLLRLFLQDELEKPIEDEEAPR